MPFIPAGGIQKFPASPALASQGNELIKLILNVETQNQYSQMYLLIKCGIYYESRMKNVRNTKDFSGKIK